MPTITSRGNHGVPAGDIGNSCQIQIRFDLALLDGQPNAGRNVRVLDKPEPQDNPGEPGADLPDLHPFAGRNVRQLSQLDSDNQHPFM